jgi:prepilin-type N-terminal cleavage/methylation domain-containing protein
MQRDMFDQGALWTSRKRSLQPPFPIQTAGNAFTLIELLMVVAIISILTGLLIPNLSRSKTAARLIACQSNVRQIGLGLQTYVSDNHYYPVNDLNNTKPLSHADSERFWTGKLLREAFRISQPARNFSQKGVWRCPSARWDASMLPC